MLRHARILLIVLAIASPVVAQTAAPAAPQSKDAKIRQLLKLMKVTDLAVQMMDQMMSTFEGMAPNAPAGFWTKFRAQVKADEILDLLVPIYAKHLEEADIDKLNEFYASPAGQHLIAAQPLIMSESMAAGQAWGEKIGARALEQLKAATPDGE